jgi:hypothetical protein
MVARLFGVSESGAHSIAPHDNRTPRAEKRKQEARIASPTLKKDDRSPSSVAATAASFPEKG